MKQLASIVVAAALWAGPALAADPIEGLWKTAPDDNGNFGHIVVKPCGAKICGTLSKAFKQLGSGNPKR